jgi:hypothetical protein
VALVSDSNGNPVSGVTVTFTAPSTGASGTFANSTTATTGSNGQATASTFTANTIAGGYTVTASAPGASTSASFSLTNSPGTAKTLTVSGYPSPVVSGTSNSLTVTAKDQFGNIATGYTGTVAFTATAASKTLPAPYTFTGSGTGKDNGRHQFSATLNNFGAQSISATDTVTGTITGSQTGIVVTASKLVMTAASTTPAAGAADNLTITAQDATGATATNYTGDATLTFSGASTSPNGTHPTVTNKGGASAVNFANQETITFASGVASNTTTGASGQLAMTLYDAQTASIVVSDGTINNGSGLSVTVSGPPTPFSSNSSKYNYTDNTSPTADTISGNNGTLTAGTGETLTSLVLVAIETAGAHVGNQYTSTGATAQGGTSAFNVDNATSSTSYKFAEADQWGNQSTGFAGPFSFADTK